MLLPLRKHLLPAKPYLHITNDLRCVISAPLSLLCKNMVTSFVYSYDAISRLSLGSMRDMNRAAYWLCEGTGEASTINLLRRALQGKFRLGGSKLDTEEEKKWVSPRIDSTGKSCHRTMFSFSSLPSAKRSKPACIMQTCSLRDESGGC